MAGKIILDDLLMLRLSSFSGEMFIVFANGCDYWVSTFTLSFLYEISYSSDICK